MIRLDGLWKKELGSNDTSKNTNEESKELLTIVQKEKIYGVSTDTVEVWRVRYDE